jgi:hypothetical protein
VPDPRVQVQEAVVQAALSLVQHHHDHHLRHPVVQVHPGTEEDHLRDDNTRMKSYIYLWFTSFLMLVGCYTLLRHPTGIRDANTQSEYIKQKIVVTEDCNSCHNDFNAINHFAPVSPHQGGDWFNIPWWLQDDYLTIFQSSSQSEDPVFDSPEPGRGTIIPKTAPPAYRGSSLDSSRYNAQEILKSARTDSAESYQQRDIGEKKKNSRRTFRKRD